MEKKKSSSLPMKLAILLLFNPFLGLLLSSAPVNALNIGVQLVNSGISVSATSPISSSHYMSKQQCSRKCESQHCNVPPFLRYGKYCGILYTGCPGEKPCDALDACCMLHDACVQSKNNDYLSEECSENFLDCVGKVKENVGKRKTFKGNKCNVEEEADVMTLVMEAALLAGRVLHKP